MTRSKSTPTNRGRKQPEPAAPTWDERIIGQLLPWRQELAGLLLFVIAFISLLALLNLTQAGPLANWTSLLRRLAGWGVYPLILLMAALGLYLMVARFEGVFRITIGQVIGLELALLTSLILTHSLFGGGLSGALAGRGGGLIGWAISEPLLTFVGPLLTGALILGLALLSLAMILKIRWADIIRWLNRASLRLQLWSNELEVDIAQREAYLEARSSAPESPVRPQPVMVVGEADLAPEPAKDQLIIIEDAAADAAPKLHRRDRRLPPVTILEEGGSLALAPEEIDLKKEIIEQTLADFGLPATVTEVRRGPAVTQFGVTPGYVERSGPDGAPKRYKVRVNQIARLRQDLALALAVPRLRIEAPVPGRGIVGVEVPNAETSIVRLRPIVESEAFYRLTSPLAVGLGRDVAGAPVVTDLGKLPHLLIAGTTGSGKSVCLNSLITCLALNNTPEQLRMVMIDPKKVELIRFNGMPHLLGQVEVEPERVVGVLRWLTSEMDRRYELFAAAGAKQLRDYNRRLETSRRRQASRSGDAPSAIPLPYIAVFVDELADLMTMFPGDVESTLCRLAQMARATGIHLVVATQRPSTDVITGLIKANFPARASFSVASTTDSRVILDTVGAEHLMGKGDMLYLPPDVSAPLRVQGCFVSDREIEAVVSHWQKSMPQPPAEPLPDEGDQDDDAAKAPWERLIAREAFVSERDEMLEEAIALAKKNDKISTSYIQRRLRVGYPRAARLMEALYEMGLVEDPKEGGRTRRTYVNEDDDPLDDILG
ncbi:MAG: DNA translocase FtsK [Chloroflexota bacterium]|jgi:S-DNA-T family DNA segregation ATPase FtsK/SpoIIIE